MVKDSNATYTPGLYERRSGSTRQLHHNLKNVELQTTLTPAVSASRTYDAFGNILGGTGTHLGPFGYGGGFGYQEDATGLQLLGHRLYDSSTGRFLTRDPIKDGRNWYTYCDSDPVSRFDNEGTLWWYVAFAAVAVIYAGWEWYKGNNPRDAGINGGALVGGYVLPSPAGELAGAAPAAGPMLGIAVVKRIEKQHQRDEVEDPYDENGDSFDDFDQDGDSSGSHNAKKVLSATYGQ